MTGESATENGAASESAVGRLGLAQGQVVQEYGWDDDVDEAFRQAAEEVVGAPLEDEEYTGAADAVLLWWREEDGDVGDALVDALRDLSTTGHIWLLTPKIGRDGYVDPADIAEGTATAGLVLANPASVSREWQAQKIVRPKAGRR